MRPKTGRLVKFSLAINTNDDLCLAFSCSISVVNSGSVSTSEWFKSCPVAAFVAKQRVPVAVVLLILVRKEDDDGFCLFKNEEAAVRRRRDDDDDEQSMMAVDS